MVTALIDSVYSYATRHLSNQSILICLYPVMKSTGFVLAYEEVQNSDDISIIETTIYSISQYYTPALSTIS